MRPICTALTRRWQGFFRVACGLAQSTVLRPTDKAEITRPVAPKRFGSATGAAGWKLQPTPRKKPFVGRHDER
jgi:hypothetical protein